MNELGKYFSEIRYMDCRTPYKMKPGAEWLKKGNFTPAELQAAYAETDVFFKWGREGWGFPLLEAMSAGALVITNCVHLPYLEDRKNCLQFRDAPALQRVLNLASRQKLTEIKREGQKTAKSLTWGKAVAEARKLIEASMK